MKLFLTSSHTLGWAGDLNPANGLAAELVETFADKPIRCLMVSSYPDDVVITDRMAWEIRECFDRAGIPFSHYEVLDRRTFRHASRMFHNVNLIILCGGHVPTENRFFTQLRLKERIAGFDGVMLGISAGSMNCAGRVYSPPELEGEAVDSEYVNYLEGLGLTDVNILPHYQNLRNTRIDGFHLMKDIVLKDCAAHPVWCLPDGSYFLIEGERTELRGKAYKAHHGKVRLVCHDDESRLLLPDGRLKKIK